MDSESVSDGPRSKKPRKSKPKVKTGCLTCKTRRVKCDETRPQCLRCQKSGRVCDGYAVALKGPPRQLAPRSQTGRALARIQPNRIASTCIPPSPSMALFDDEREARYFQLYRDRTATKLGGYLDAGIWTRLILQACHQEAFAKHAIVSIGALDIAMAHQPPRRRSLPIDPKQFVDNEHHHFALREYGKALRLMRASPSDSEMHHVRKALISCLLIICFETYRGDPDLALVQARTAVKILTTWLKKVRADKRLPSSLRPATERPEEVEEDLINAFARLYKGVMVFRAPRPAEFTTLLMPEAIEKLENMPSTFTNLEEARKYWEFHLRLALPWNHQPGHDSLQASGFPKVFPDRIRNQDVHFAPPRQDAAAATARLQEEREGHLKTLLRWRAALGPVWEECNTPEGAENFAGAALLTVQSFCGIISFNAAAVNDELVFDQFTPEFGQMISLARKVLEGTELTRFGSANLFSFSIGVITSIYFVIIKCRDRAIRRQGLELFDKYPRRDGVWDSAMASAVGRWVVEKEEHGLEPDAPIPEASRLRLMQVSIPSSKTEAIIRYTLMEGKSPRDRIMPPPETVTW